jgi:hypothetical protein
MEYIDKLYEEGLFKQLKDNGFLSDDEYIRCLEELDRRYKNKKIA